MDSSSRSTKSSSWQDFVKQCNLWCIALLLGSGLIHGVLVAIDTTPWGDPISFRKPFLFGLSTGLTLWSCDWCFRQFKPFAWANVLRMVLGLSLLLEVGLITLQTWRGEASHFNRSGLINAGIESGMLLFIVMAMAIILMLAIWSTFGQFLPNVSASMRIAIWWGLHYLVLSGLIGFVITFVGHMQQLAGKPPEFWGERGVLKFPHGATLHAIQTLAVVAWIADRMWLGKGEAIVRAVSYMHGVVLVLAIHHTFLGRGRFEFDMVSWVIAGVGIGVCCIPLVQSRVQK